MINKRLWYLFSWLTILTALFLMSMVIYWLIYPYKTVDFKKDVFPVENKIVEQGGRLRYEIDYCKYNETIPQITRYFVDGVLYETPEISGGLISGCNNIMRDIYIPKAIPDGNYKIKIVIHYRLNPIRTVEIVKFTEQFIIK